MIPNQQSMADKLLLEFHGSPIDYADIDYNLRSMICFVTAAPLPSKNCEMLHRQCGSKGGGSHEATMQLLQSRVITPANQ